MRAIIFFVLFSIPGLASAENVYVKYRGPVDLKPFSCETVRGGPEKSGSRLSDALLLGCCRFTDRT
jgi:hypothetical protein